MKQHIHFPDLVCLVITNEQSILKFKLLGPGVHENLTWDVAQDIMKPREK